MKTHLYFFTVGIIIKVVGQYGLMVPYLVTLHEKLVDKQPSPCTFPDSFAGSGRQDIIWH